ncbi:hypothetical protein [Shewanella algidipiscicola]|uniref:Uncharacterized protein n=1 Tax=Shewanella algidipiscicola TaxID=614070 RepID=A0ABQ4PN05_9GAMM|nr:hypothetical protein [Shewanella algidipiscicola]GIU49768.1 hypothetical protein TUM4630_29180 [Shewanella algidipiscicola]
MVKMELTKQRLLQLILILLIIVLLSTIIYPAWTVANARFILKTDNESGATLAERYLLLGDWPSGNEDMLLTHFDDFQVNVESLPNGSTIKSAPTSNVISQPEASQQP